MSSTFDFAGNASPNVAAFLADIAELGVTVASEQGGGSAYGMFGARSNDRYWLLPLAPRAATRAGLGLFQPASQMALCARSLADLAMRARLDRLWARGRVRLSGLPDMKVDFGQPSVAYAYFTGTAGPHRKTAIQAMASDGSILGYGKLTRNPAIAPFVAAEAAMLDRLAKVKLRSAAVPRRLSYRTGEGKVTLLVTDSRKSTASRSPTELGSAHLAFLRELEARSGRTGDPSAAQALNDRLTQAANGPVTEVWRARLRAGADALRGQMQTLRTVLTHGDFTPWNIFLDSEGLYVFDWEYAQDAYPLGYDLARFLLSRPSEMAIETQHQSVLATMSDTLFNGDRSIARNHFHLSLLMHAAFYLERATLAEDSVWDEDARYGALVDAFAQ
ncbi:aminoglycoside phosphotransferase family protein [Antarcticimicrobium sediminis]|nr:aminoglycoside phosphotransferase family protein [Antarcticimicrobium sediminis]